MSASPAAAGSQETLATLREHAILAPQQAEAWQRRHDAPWWLNALLAIAAWIASLLIFASFFTPLLLTGNSATARAIGGIALLTIALLLFRRREHTFSSQMALAFSLAGQALLASLAFDLPGSYRHNWHAACHAGALIAMALLLPRSTLAHRSLCALIAFGCLLAPVSSHAVIEAMALLIALLAVALWLRRQRWAAGKYAPWLKACANAATLMTLVMARSITLHPGGSPFDLLHVFGGEISSPAISPLYALGAILLLLGVVMRLTTKMATPQRLMTLTTTLAVSAPGAAAPGLIVVAALLLALFHARRRIWLAVSLSAAVVMIGEYYYALHLSLLIKSLMLFSLGLALLGVAWLLKKRAGKTR